MPSRRTYLAGLGTGFAGLAGCSGRLAPTGGSDPAGTPSTTTGPEPREWGETATVAGVRVTPEDASVRHSAFHYLTPETLGVTAFENQRAVFVTLETASGVPEPDAFELAVADGREGWVEAPNGQRLHRPDTAYPYGENGDGSGWVGFTAPALDEGTGGELRVEHDGEAAVWTLPESVLESLAAPAPDLAVENVSVPESVPAEEMFDVSVTARNEGDVAGTFLAALNESGPSYAPQTIAMDLNPGASETWTESFWADEAGTEKRFGFRTAETEHEYTVEVTE